MSVNVAIVEDESEYARELQDYLRRYGREVGERFDITVYPDGEDIVDDYRSGMYDIILMDIEMKSMDGMTAAEHIRDVDGDWSSCSSPTWRNTPSEDIVWTRSTMCSNRFRISPSPNVSARRWSACVDVRKNM